MGISLVPLAVPASGNCPEGMARIGEQFCIDRYEAALMEQLPNGGERAWSPYHSPDHVRVRAVSQRGIVPQGYISQVQAARACRSAGKRLCDDREWMDACRGPQHTVFPYGDNRENGRCNENHARHPTIELYGHSGGNIWDWAHQNDPLTNQLPGTLALTGAFEGCTNEYGVYDMVGNLHEWTADHDGTFRGGYYMDTRINGNGCLYVTTAHNRSYHDFTTGFRCCADVGAGH